jgi:hypothetical protein
MDQSQQTSPPAPTPAPISPGAPTGSSYPFAQGEYEWVEKAAIENLKGRRETADVLAKEAQTTLTVLLAGAGGAWAYAVKLLDSAATRGGVAALVAAAWLTLLAMLLVWWCMRIQPIPAIYNQPSKLLERPNSGESFEEWRLGELHGIQARIDKAVARNGLYAKRLNRIRVLATLTPVLALLGVGSFELIRMCR